MSVARDVAAWLAISALVISCGAPPRSPLRMDTITGEAAGTELVVLPRSTRGRVWLSLWVDAGARDADPPQVATAAAWIAAPEDVRAHVLPDGIEFARPCRREQLDTCLRSLASAVATRDLAPDALAAVRRKLTDARRRAGADETRRADALALEALLGASADPLGASEDDARVTERAIGAFLRDHVGAGRLLLVAVGDVEPTELRAHVEAIFGAVPPARAARARREWQGRRALRVDVGDSSVLAAATLRPNLADAAHLARALVARVDADVPGSGASADVFPTRGGAAVIGRVRDDENAARALLDHLAELAEAPSIDRDVPPPPSDVPPERARWIGARWIARQDHEVRGGLGVGAIVAGGRGDRLDATDPDAETRDAARRVLEAQLRTFSEPPPAHGSIDDEGAELSLRNGARLFARRLAGADRVSALVLFEGGAEDDPPSAHGTSALLARAAADGCERVARRELGIVLDALDVRAEPILRASAWGLAVEGPTERWREVAFLATRCASVPHLDAAAVASAKEAVIALAERPRPSALALAARAIAPSAPGRIAPLGSVPELSAIGASELRRARAKKVAGVRARVAVAADAPIPEIARILARGAARWPEGTAPGQEPPSSARTRRGAARRDSPDDRPHPGRALPVPFSAPHPEGRHEAIVAWTIDSAAGGTEVAAAAFARAAARALDAEPGLRVRWHEGRAERGRAWAIVALDPSPDALDALPAHVARALRAVQRSWRELEDEAVREADERRAWAESSPRGVAMLLALGALEPPTPEITRRTLAQLAESPPRFVVLRPELARR